jgi:HPt (histidine-containing phosphotransfer) domain-containing protein
VRKYLIDYKKQDLSYTASFKQKGNETMELLIRQLKQIGVDVDSALCRLGGKELIYLSICKKFVLDSNFQLFKDTIKAGDREKAGIYLHTLKGVAANLGFTRLEMLCKALYTDLRNEDSQLFQHNINSLTGEYQRIISVLKSGAENEINLEVEK